MKPVYTLINTSATDTPLTADDGLRGGSFAYQMHASSYRTDIYVLSFSVLHQSRMAFCIWQSELKYNVGLILKHIEWDNRRNLFRDSCIGSFFVNRGVSPEVASLCLDAHLKFLKKIYSWLEVTFASHIYATFSHICHMDHIITSFWRSVVHMVWLPI